METTSFSNWITENFYPIAIVFSTDKTKIIISKNNLSPAEFLRPFGLFDRIIFSPNLRFEMTLKNFRMDFQDSETFQRISRSKLQETTDNLLLNKSIVPHWNFANNVSSLKSIMKNGYDVLLKKTKNYSLPWFNEYEKMYLEFFRFNEYEFYQQPFAYIYTCAVGDELRKIAPSKEKIPHLIYEKIYELNMPVVIIVFVDKSDPSITNEKAESYYNKVRLEYKKFNVYKLDINTNNGLDNPIKNDIWLKYIHKYDLYNSSFSENYIRGAYISEPERLKDKTFFLEIMTKVIINQIGFIVNHLEDEISTKKKGIKNALFNMFQKNETKEYNEYFQIINLTDIEKKEYLLSIIYFYFRNYRGAYENIKYFISDVSARSPGHYNAGFELKFICDFLLHYDTRDIDYKEAFYNYVNFQQYWQAFRVLLITTKMMEEKRIYSQLTDLLSTLLYDLPNSQTRVNSKPLPHAQVISRISPLVNEKLSYYFLIQTRKQGRKQYRRFIANLLNSALYYLNENEKYIHYALNIIGTVYPFLSERNFSFVKEKEEFNKIAGDICKNLKYYEGAIKFYKNCFEFGKYSQKNNMLPQYNNLLSCIKEIINNNKNNNNSKDNNILSDLYDLTIPEVDNTSLLVIYERDYNISEDKNVIGNWYWFSKYSLVPLKKQYISLSLNDLISLKNLDNIIGKKQNLNFSKKNFQGLVNGKIFIRFNIKNPIILDLKITSIKLICEYINNTNIINNNKNNTTTSENNVEKNNENNYLSEKEAIEYEEKSFVLPGKTVKEIQLYCKCLKEGILIIRGVEIKIDDLIVIKHFFNKKNLSKLYNYRIKKKNSELIIKTGIRKSSSSSNEEMNLSSPNNISEKSLFSKKHEINFKIIDNSANIIVDFPMGETVDIYKNQLIFMPIKIKNNSAAKIKRFTLFFKEDDLKGKRKYLKNDNILSDYISKEIDLYENPYNPNSKLETIVYVPINPREVGILYIKILIKFEEDLSIKDNEVKRYLIKLNVKNSINIDIKNIINKSLPVQSDIDNNNQKQNTIKKDEKIYNFTLKTTASIIDKEKFKDIEINDNVYTDSKYKRENDFDNNINNNPTIINISNDDTRKYYNFTFSKKITNLKSRSKMSSIFGYYNYGNEKIKMADITNFSNQINFDFIPEDILNDPFQSHIKYKFCQILLKNNLIFTWKCINKEDNQIINGLFIYQPAFRELKIDCNFLHNLFDKICITNVQFQKIDAQMTVININIKINTINLVEIEQVLSYEFYIDDDKEFQWFGIKSFLIKNQSNKFLNYYNNNNSNNIKDINFSCIYNKKGRIDINKIGIKISTNDRLEPYILRGCPIIKDILIN